MTETTELLGAWLDRRLESVPQELAVRIRAVLPPDWRNSYTEQAPALLADTAARELRGLLERGCEERWAAPGLLVVDALVTYACELIALSNRDIETDSAALLDTMLSVMPQDDSAA